MRSIGAAIRTLIAIIAVATWAYRAAHLASRLLQRARDPDAAPPEDLAEVLADAAMDASAEALADVPSLEPDPAAEAVNRASTRWRHTG